MASTAQNDAVFPDPDEDDDLESLPDDESPPPPTAVTNFQQPQQPPQPSRDDSSRKLFQRLWTDEDEIELLQGFLEYTTARRANNGHHHDTSAFYDQIKSKLQLDFNKSQLVEKLRRLKKKYRNVLKKMSCGNGIGNNGNGKEFVFKSSHDQITFELSSKIWSDSVNCDDFNGNSNGDGDGSNDGLNGVEVKVEEVRTPRSSKRSRLSSGGYGDGLGGVVEETVRNCLSPVVKEVLSGVRGLGGGVGAGMASPSIGLGVGGFGGAGMMSPMGSGIVGFGGGVGMFSVLGFGGIGCLGGQGGFMGFGVSGGGEVDEKWKKQQILELEVYLKRIELVQEQVRAALEKLRSMEG